MQHEQFAATIRSLHDQVTSLVLNSEASLLMNHLTSPFYRYIKSLDILPS